MSEFRSLNGFWWVIVDGDMTVAEYSNGAWWLPGRNTPVQPDKVGPAIDPPDTTE